MHELSVATNILEIVEEQSSLSQVLEINVGIGAFSGVYESPLLFYLEILLNDKTFPNIKINISHISGRFDCVCGETYCAKDISRQCPKCGEYQRELVDGKDCFVESIIVNE
jgi:hydrogenase nickel incorporation protein HypA/HybF